MNSPQYDSYSSSTPFLDSSSLCDFHENGSIFSEFHMIDNINNDFTSNSWLADDKYTPVILPPPQRKKKQKRPNDGISYEFLQSVEQLITRKRNYLKQKDDLFLSVDTELPDNILASPRREGAENGGEAENVVNKHANSCSSLVLDDNLATSFDDILKKVKREMDLNDEEEVTSDCDIEYLEELLANIPDDTFFLRDVPIVEANPGSHVNSTEIDSKEGVPSLAEETKVLCSIQEKEDDEIVGVQNRSPVEAEKSVVIKKEKEDEAYVPDEAIYCEPQTGMVVEDCYLIPNQYIKEEVMPSQYIKEEVVPPSPAEDTKVLFSIKKENVIPIKQEEEYAISVKKEDVISGDLRSSCSHVLNTKKECGGHDEHQVVPKQAQHVALKTSKTISHKKSTAKCNSSKEKNKKGRTSKERKEVKKEQLPVMEDAFKVHDSDVEDAAQSNTVEETFQFDSDNNSPENEIKVVISNVQSVHAEKKVEKKKISYQEYLRKRALEMKGPKSDADGEKKIAVEIKKEPLSVYEDKQVPNLPDVKKPSKEASHDGDEQKTMASLKATTNKCSLPLYLPNENNQRSLDNCDQYSSSGISSCRNSSVSSLCGSPSDEKSNDTKYTENDNSDDSKNASASLLLKESPFALNLELLRKKDSGSRKRHKHKKRKKYRKRYDSSSSSYGYESDSSYDEGRHSKKKSCSKSSSSKHSQYPDSIVLSPPYRYVSWNEVPFYNSVSSGYYPPPVWGLPPPEFGYMPLFPTSTPEIAQFHPDSHKYYDDQLNSSKDDALRERRVLFVGSIEPGTTQKDLRTRFEEFGTIEKANVFHKPNRNSYGFVTFTKPEYVLKAIEHGNDNPSLPVYALSFGGRKVGVNPGNEGNRYGVHDCSYYPYEKGFGQYGPQSTETDSFRMKLEELKDELQQKKLNAQPKNK